MAQKSTRCLHLAGLFGRWLSPGSYPTLAVPTRDGAMGTSGLCCRYPSGAGWDLGTRDVASVQDRASLREVHKSGSGTTIGLTLRCTGRHRRCHSEFGELSWQCRG